MDGFNVGNFQVDHEYELDSQTANYLIVAGYAVRVDADKPLHPLTQNSSSGLSLKSQPVKKR
jgi:hypothetical protein